MLYNNKTTLSALALILAMSFTLAEVSHAQGVISLNEDSGSDELGFSDDAPAFSEEETATVEEFAEPTDEADFSAPNTEEEPFDASSEGTEENASFEPAFEEENADAAFDDNFLPPQEPMVQADGFGADDGFSQPASPLLAPSNDMSNKESSLLSLQTQKENEMGSLDALGNSVLSQIDNELFSQMSDIEKQTTLLSLELRREKLKSEIAAIQTQRQRAIEEQQEEKEAREQRKREQKAEKEIEILKEKQILKDREIALEALRQEKALNDYRNKMLENDQKWIGENQKLYDNIRRLEDEKRDLINNFTAKLDILAEISGRQMEAASNARQNYNQAISDLNMQNSQLRKRLDAETSVGTNPFSTDGDTEEEVTPESLNKDYIIMEIRGKGANLVAKLISKDGESFFVKQGSLLQTGHRVEQITHNYIVLDKKGIKDYIQFSTGGVVEQELDDYTDKAASGSKIPAKKAGATERPKPPLVSDDSIPSLGSGMFVK